MISTASPSALAAKPTDRLLPPPVARCGRSTVDRDGSRVAAMTAVDAPKSWSVTGETEGGHRGRRAGSPVSASAAAGAWDAADVNAPPPVGLPPQDGPARPAGDAADETTPPCAPPPRSPPPSRTPQWHSLTTTTSGELSSRANDDPPDSAEPPPRRRLTGRTDGDGGDGDESRKTTSPPLISVSRLGSTSG